MNTKCLNQKKLADRKIFRIAYAIFVGALFVLLASCQEKKSPEYVFRASHLVNENHTWYKAFAYFSEILEERSKGRIVVENYHSEQLAKESEAIRLIQAGVIDMTTTGSVLNNWEEIIAFCELPFLLKDSVDMKTIINGPIGQRMEEAMLKIGLRPLGYFQRGPRHLTSNRPIRHPDDLKGLIVRVPNVPSFITAWQSLGAKPTPMAFSEVFTSLQQGTIQAQENPFAMIRAAGFSEVQKYVNLTAHVVSWTYPVIGEKQFQKLPDDLKEIFLEAARDMQAYEHRLFVENEKKVQQELKDQGMVFVEVDKEAFALASREAIFSSLSPEMQAIYNDIVSNLKSRRP
ncbi:TRAP transporter substrate-binding protein [Pseudozobellia thermophila]|uniref:Tripartite ATP-independent transporter solute receptor, DctP family n=1 Tax=Pseudozobellia thermophila TaxID=192903 RepID=A0A1M6KTL9_9FLAO|nr:TRAP transporter substrate-binding protein [Pseudozobellia thermophila]SHJ62256.1 tripartite ATP-independent transporter solute receptor, DctP family [Pseudozobellia thermophila]